MTLNEQTKIKGVYPEAQIDNLDDLARYVYWFWSDSGRGDIDFLDSDEDISLNFPAVIAVRGIKEGLGITFSSYSDSFEYTRISTSLFFNAVKKYQSMIPKFQLSYTDSLRNSKINVENIFNEAMALGEKQIAEVPLQWNIYKRFKKEYLATGTFGVRYDARMRSFVLSANKAFLIEFIIGYMLMGYQSPTVSLVHRTKTFEDPMSDDNKVFQVASVKDKLGTAVAYMLRHEVSHVSSLHVNSAGFDLNDGFTFKENNIWQDCIINYAITRFIPGTGGDSSGILIPKAGFGRAIITDSTILGSKLLAFKDGEITLEDGTKFECVSGYISTNDWFNQIKPDETYKVIVYMSPSSIQQNASNSRSGKAKTTTADIMYLYKFFKDYFKFRLINTNKAESAPAKSPIRQPKTSPDEPEKEKKIVIRKGDITVSKSSKEYGEVVGVDPVTGVVDVRVFGDDERDTVLHDLGISRSK